MSPTIQNFVPPLNLLVLIPMLSFISLVAWVVYARFFHPLAKYPGPFFASITRLWHIIDVASGSSDKTQRQLHEKYGNFASPILKDIIKTDSRRTDCSDSPK